MWLLARLLPAMVGSKVPEGDEHWKNFLLMLEITDYLFAPRITEDDIGYLEYMIKLHHDEFCELYPHRSVIPKMHYIVHMPRLMHL
jgi:hypothetical protein